MDGAVLVTGGSSGIGSEVCRHFVRTGHSVVSLDRIPPAEGGAGYHHIAVDLADEAATRDVAADIAATYRVARFVHCAGVIRPALLADVDPADLRDLTQLHLVAPLLLTQAVLPAMRAARFGRIVLISSRAALGLATRSSYAATKAGLLGLARTWALELAPDGITVNVVAPGPIAGTAMFQDVVPAGSDRETALARAIPVGRLGTPADVARAVAFLADDASGFITGQTLFVCGGSSVGSLAI